MKIYIAASKQFYPQVAKIIPKLTKLGHKVTPPNGYENPELEGEIQKSNAKQYQKWKAEMTRKDGKIVKENDALLVLNFEKHGQKNYIGGAVFLEMFMAFNLGKKIFLYNPIPESMLTDEIIGLGPKVINGDLNLIK